MRKEVAVVSISRSIIPLLLAVFSAHHVNGEEPGRPSTTDLIRQLGSDRYRERESAHNALLKRDDAIPQIRRSLPTLNAEGRRRASSILDLFFQRRTQRFLRYGREGRVDLLVEWSALAGPQIDAQAFWQCVLDVAWEHIEKTQGKEGVAEFRKHFGARTYGDLLKQGPIILNDVETIDGWM